MINSRKKGFTLVELVIVIAVVAILVAVLIPTFGSLIRKANMSSDQVATRDMNTLLSLEKVEKNKLNIEDIKAILKEAGYRTDDLSPLTKGFAFYWIEDLQIIVLYDLEKDVVVFPTNLDLKYPDNGEGWLLLSEIVADEKVFPGEYVLLNGSGVSISFTENNEIQVYIDGEKALLIPSENIVMTENGFSIINTDNYDGDFTICDDGYIECDGVPVAKKEELWVNLPSQENSVYLIIRDGVVYTSNDGNGVSEEYIPAETIGNMVNTFIGKLEKYPGYPYQFEEFDGTLKVGTIFDALAAKTLEDKAWFQLTFMNCYEYWGGTAYDTKESDSLTTHGSWEATAVTSIEKTRVYSIVDSQKIKLDTTDVLSDGVYVIEETVTYYHDGNVTENIMMFEDYPLYFETGMTYRQWMHKYGCKAATDTWSGFEGKYYYYYIDEDYLDMTCEAGYANKICGGSETGYISSDQIGYIDNNGNFNTEEFFYSYGLIQFKPYETTEEAEFVGYEWDGGFIAVGTEMYAEEIFNYYLGNGLDIPDRIELTPVYEPTN